MKPLLFLSTLAIIAIGALEPTNAPKTNTFDAELIPPPDTNAPIKLQSGVTNKPAPPRLPVYVLPEMLVTTLPDGTRFMFIEQHHLNELAKKFRTVRYTNLVIYSDGI